MVIHIFFNRNKPYLKDKKSAEIWKKNWIFQEKSKRGQNRFLSVFFFNSALLTLQHTK